jgi:plastocyanin
MTRLLLAFTLAVVIPGAIAPSVDFTGTARVGGKPLEDAVIWIDAPDGSGPREAARAVLNQRDVQFFPHVLVVQVGTKVKFPNQDRVFHNVFSYHDGARFDLGLYPVGTVREWVFDRPGLSRVFCNIHPQMAAYIMVVETPYFAATDRAGRFTIRGVPAGTHRYHAWRAGGTMLSAEVAVDADEPFEVRWP